MTLDTDYKLFKFVFLVSLCSHMILIGTSFFTTTLILLLFRIIGIVIVSVITGLAVVFFTKHFIQKSKGG